MVLKRYKNKAEMKELKKTTLHLLWCFCRCWVGVCLKSTETRQYTQEVYIYRRTFLARGMNAFCASDECVGAGDERIESTLSNFSHTHMHKATATHTVTATTTAAKLI